jgi:hypothetical protein
LRDQLVRWTGSGRQGGFYLIYVEIRHGYSFLRAKALG